MPLTWSAACIWHRIYLTQHCQLMLSNIWILNLAVPKVLIAAAEQYFLLMCCSSQHAGEFLHWREPCELKSDSWLVCEVFDIQDFFFFFNSKFVYFTQSLEFGVMPRALVSSGFCRTAHLFINTISTALSWLLTQWAQFSVGPDLASTSCAFGHFLKGQEHPMQDWSDWSLQLIIPNHMRMR